MLAENQWAGCAGYWSPLGPHFGAVEFAGWLMEGAGWMTGQLAGWLAGMASERGRGVAREGLLPAFFGRHLHFLRPTLLPLPDPLLCSPF